MAAVQVGTQLSVEWNKAWFFFLDGAPSQSIHCDGISMVSQPFCRAVVPPLGLGGVAVGYFHRRWAPASASSLIVPWTGGL